MIQVVRRSIVDIYNLYSFSRGSLAYDSKGKLYHLYNARFEAGKFSQAVMVEEGTTNQLTDPSVEAGLPQGNFYNWAGVGTPTEGRTTAEKHSGAYSYYVQGDGVNPLNAGRYFGFSYTAGNQYAFSVWAKATVANCYVRFYNGASTGDVDVGPLPVGQWYRAEHVYTASSTGSFETHVFAVGGPANATVYLDDGQIEVKPYTTSFIDGTRSPETLTIPTAGVLNPQEGTVECWVYAQGDMISAAPASSHAVFGSGVSNCIVLFKDNGNSNWVVRIYSGGTLVNIGSVSFTPTIGWHHFVCRWNFSEVALFVDAVKKITIPSPTLPVSWPTNFGIGYWEGSGSYINSLIDDLRFSSRARTDAEISAAYSSNAPLPVDADTTLKLNFDGPDAQRAAKVLVV